MVTKILVVDDVYTSRLKTQLILNHVGNYTVQAVSNGPEAIRIACIFEPAVVVMDIVMAGMDGIATLRALRTHGITCPVIAYTARREQKTGEFQRHGFDAYVSKLETVHSLLVVLRIILSKFEQDTPSDMGDTLPNTPSDMGNALPIHPSLPRLQMLSP